MTENQENQDKQGWQDRQGRSQRKLHPRAVVFVLVVLAVLWARISYWPDVKSWWQNRQERIAYEKMLKADTDGGKTPEETRALFISALESADIELAGSYFVIEKRDAWKKTLEVYKEAGILEEFIKELKANFDGEYIQYPSGNWKIEF